MKYNDLECRRNRFSRVCSIHLWTIHKENLHANHGKTFGDLPKNLRNIAQISTVAPGTVHDSQLRWLLLQITIPYQIYTCVGIIEVSNQV